MSLGGSTGYAINPARDLGPRIAHFILPIIGKGKSDWSYSWIPIVGPLIGGSFGSLSYLALFKAQVSMAFWITLVLVITIIIMAVLEQKKNEN
jgi:glycerol uptake facilitator protein